jgi:hypothetical protein
MFVATAIVSVLLASLLALSAAIKLTRREPYVQGYINVGVPEDKLNSLAIVLLAGAAGLVLGLFWAPVGIAAAIGVIAYFIVAVAAHIRADDAENLPTPLVLEAMAIAALALRIATL